MMKLSFLYNFFKVFILLFIFTTSVYAQQIVGELETVETNSVNFNERSFYMLINKVNGLAMDVEGRSVVNDANIILNTKDKNVMHQVWRMDDLGNGVYNLANAHSDKVVRESGNNVRQERDGKSNTHRWEIVHMGEGYFKLINVGRKTVLTADGNNVIGAADNNSDAQRWKILEVKASAVEPEFNIQGFATVGQGTTGGEGGKTVVVRTEQELIHYMQHRDPYIILIDGTIELGRGDHHRPEHHMHSIAPNKTLFGLDGATIKGGGFNIRGTRNDGVGQVTRTNIIIRNLIFDGGSPDDYINVEHGATNVWIDHNTFNGPNTDGMVDVKREASFVTISWNIIHTNHKTMLLGHDDNHTHDRGYLKVTYHHNYVYNSQSRHPRMRYGRAHLFNNYFENIGDYVMGPGVEAEIISENNHVWVSGRFTDWYHNTGKVLERGQGSLINRINHDHDPRIVTSQIDWTPEEYYSYKMNPAIAVRNMILEHAGAGKISWTDSIPEYVGIVDNGDNGNGNGNGGDPGGNGGSTTYTLLHDWNFSAMSQYNSNFAVSGSMEIDGATLYNSIEVDGMGSRTQVIDGETYSYTRRVKLGGAGTFSGSTPTARVYAFEVPGNARITVVCQSSSGSADRVLNIATSPDDILVAAPAPGANMQMTSYEYRGPATPIYLFSPVSGVNIYHVRVESVEIDNSTSVDETWRSEANIIREKYYNLNGVEVYPDNYELPTGIYIRRMWYDDGTIRSEKFFNNKR